MNQAVRFKDDVRIQTVGYNELSHYEKWMISGEWRHFDAPWEMTDNNWQPDELQKFRDNFRQQTEKQQNQISKCTIYYQNRPIGWVNAYKFSYDKTSVKIGICICEDNHLCKGIGTISLKLWLDYWFVDRKMHRVGLDTWSLNQRMIRVAEKCGFIFEGIEREVHLWQNEWQNLHHYSILSNEYKAI